MNSDGLSDKIIKFQFVHYHIKIHWEYQILSILKEINKKLMHKTLGMCALVMEQWITHPSSAGL
jgi:hypothetical protein